MSETPDNTEKGSRPSRRWYRLHLSTCLVMLMLAAVLVLIIVPGESSWQIGEMGPSEEMFEHGWPLVYLRRIERFRSQPMVRPGSVPWLQKGGWHFSVDGPEPSYWTDEVGFSGRKLACDVLIAALILAVAGTVFEWRRRRRVRAYQFTLRELCVLVFLCAGILAWWRMHHVRSQREMQVLGELCPLCKDLAGLADHQSGSYTESIGFQTSYCGPKWLRKLIGSRPLTDFYAVTFVDLDARSDLRKSTSQVNQLSYLRSLSLWSNTVTDTELESLAELDDLRELHLRGERISDGALAHLKGLTDLSELFLAETAVTSSGLVHVKHLSGLETLNLSYTKLDNVGLRHLRGLTGLRHLDVSGTAITSAGMRDLGRLRYLEILSLENTKVDAEGLAHLAALEDLRELYFRYTLVTDAGLVHLQNMSKLESLSLPEQITDAGLVHLESLESLRFLDLQSTQVTDQGVRRLRRALPDCEVL